MSWGEIVKAVNSSVTGKHAEPLDVIVKRLLGTLFSVEASEVPILTIPSKSYDVSRDEQVEDDVLVFRSLYSGTVRVKTGITHGNGISPILKVCREKKNGELETIKGIMGASANVDVSVKRDDIIHIVLSAYNGGSSIENIVVGEGSVRGSLYQNILIENEE